MEFTARKPVILSYNPIGRNVKLNFNESCDLTASGLVSNVWTLPVAKVKELKPEVGNPDAIEEIVRTASRR